MKVYDLNTQRLIKKADKLKLFLVDLDDICGKLYSNLQYTGVWNVLLKLEDIKTTQYVEYIEIKKYLETKEKK